MAEGVTYAVDVVFKGKDAGASKAIGDVAKHAAVGARKVRDFSGSLLYKRDALKDMSKHLQVGARRQRDFSSALHGTMARNRTDQIKRWFGSIREGAKGAQSPLGGLAGMLGGVAAGVGIFGALALGKSAFIDFNNSVEMSTISLAAQEKMLLGGRWSTAMTNAKGLFEDYQKVAAKSIGETTDYLDMHKGIASSAYQAGLGMKELKEMTIGATVAAIALGERADMVSLDIKQMLAGDVTSRDRTAQILLASQGVSQSAFNAMKAKDRNRIVMSALNDPALKEAAKAYGNSFAGALSAFQDNLKITLGKIGKPLFQAITKELQRWNQWVEKNPDKIAKFANDFKNALIDGFKAVKDAMSWIVENKGLLLKLAEAALVMKGASMAGGLLKAAAGAGPMGAMGRGAAAAGVGHFLGLDGWQSAVVGASAAVGGLGTAAAAAALGLQGVADYYDKRQSREMVHAADGSVLRSNISRFKSGLGAGFDMRDPDRASRSAMQVLRAAGDAGVYGKGGINREAAYRAMYGDVGTAMMLSNGGAGTPEAEALISDVRLALSEFTPTLSQVKHAAKGAHADLSTFASGFARIWNDPLYGGGLAGILGRMGALLPADAAKKPGGNDKPLEIKMPITVVSQDPDRFAVALNKAARRLATNPRAARRALREGV